MKHLQLTSDAFEGYVDFFFDNMGSLIKFDTTNATLSEDQQLFILKKIPRDIAEVTLVIGKSPSAKLTEIKQEVTFDMFWNRYDDKVSSAKKKSLKTWNNMNDTDRLKAYLFIPTYFNNMPSGTRKKFAETYLNAELWNN